MKFGPKEIGIIAFIALGAVYLYNKYGRPNLTSLPSITEGVA